MFAGNDDDNSFTTTLLFIKSKQPQKNHISESQLMQRGKKLLCAPHKFFHPQEFDLNLFLSAVEKVVPLDLAQPSLLCLFAI